MRDFTKLSDAELQRVNAMAVGDHTTLTVEDECRRMAVEQATETELRRRNLSSIEPIYRYLDDAAA